MAEGYMSWECPALNTTLYSFDVINNPDTPNDCFCPLVRPYGVNVMAAFEPNIYAAHEVGTDYDSGTVTLARVYYDGEPSTFYITLRVRYTHSTEPLGSTITLDLGYAGATGSDTKQYVIDYSNYTTWPEYRKRLYFARRLDRNSMLYDDLPGYSGTYTYLIFISTVTHLFTGAWNDPTPSRPYGQMVYTDIGINDIDGCLLSIPCASNNLESMKEQSEGLPGINQNRQLRFHTNKTDMVLTDADGNYNPDPEAPKRKDPNTEDEGGDSDEGGGDGDHRQPYVPIPIPGLPTIGPNSAGFVYMLRLTTAQMQQFALDLVRPSWWTVIKNFFADPLDFICGIMIVPYQPVSNYSVYPKFGDNIFEHAYPQVYQQYTEIDCGGLPVPKYFGSCFDNNPYTELLLWLPYIGYRKLDPDECVGKTIYVKYHCDCLTGDCVAFVMTRAAQGFDVPFDRVIAQFSGNCGVRVPFGATSFDAAIAASVQLLGGAVGAVAGGALGAAVGVSGASIGASQIGNSIAGSTVSAVNGSKVTSERSGVSGACAGYLSIQYPYLLRTVPNQSLPTNYQDLEGYPSNIAGPLTKFSGFTAVETIDLNGLDATKEEINEIKQLLVGGVYI